MPKVLYPTAELSELGAYQLLTTVVVPRPIAWVSSLSPDGVANLAPYSFFTIVSTTPPMVSFTSITEKDSVRNIRRTGEFALSITTSELIEQVNASCCNYPPEISEFEAAGIAIEPSEFIAPGGVAGSPTRMECRLVDITERGNCFVVVGEVVAWALDPAVLVDGKPDPKLLDPVGKLGGDVWSGQGELSSLPRPRYQG